ncbi:MAG: alpha-galactosidase [Terriglobales bacterium]
MKPHWVVVVVIGLILLTMGARAAELSVPENSPVVAPHNQWLQEHLLDAGAKLPFSFVYDRQPSVELLKIWPKTTANRQLDGNRMEHTLVWSDPRTGLQLRLTAVEYIGSPVVEWTIYFRNNGKADAPILEDIQALDTSVELSGSGIPIVLYSKGAGGMDCYALQKKPLNQLEAFSVSSGSGSKTIDSIPFFDIMTGGRGVIGAMGWPGTWVISFARPAEGEVMVRAGMARTHLALHPGEEIRTPQILLLPWRGDDLDAHNVLRRHILQYHTPHYDGKPVVLPVSHGGWGGMKTSTALHLIEQISNEKLGFENFWMDAGWYGKDRPVDEFQIFHREDWFLYAGDWRINKIPHPDGFKPISDAAHAHGMKFLLWFEPERAVVEAPLTTQHPEWFIGEEGVNFGGNDALPFVKYRLFDFGNPLAREFMTNFMSEFITQQGIDIFRQDCNFGPAGFWAKADASDRQGMTEIRYVEGLLQFWDELRARHPNLILDIVQRGDLESISRGVDLTRADYPVSPDADPIGNQMSTEGLAYWRPHFGTVLMTKARNTYHFRSGFAPGLVFALFNVAGTQDQVGSFIPPGFPFDWMRTMVSQLKQARPYYYGDYYPLTPCSSNSDCLPDMAERSAGFEWAAWQFNRPAEGDGMVQAFRRDQNDEAARDLRLRGIDPAATYEVTNVDAGAPVQLSGKDLMQRGLHVEITQKPGSALVFYKKVQ